MTDPAAAHCCSSCRQQSAGQSLDEMDFERGLWSAALDGEMERVEKLLDSGHHPGGTDSAGYTPLHYAARSGHAAVCERLISRGACVNATTRSGHVTPLHRAAYCGHAGVVDLLLRHGADPALRDTDGKSALHKCAETLQEAVARQLVAVQPRLVDAVDGRGHTAADCTAGRASPRLYTLLQP